MLNRFWSVPGKYRRHRAERVLALVHWRAIIYPLRMVLMEWTAAHFRVECTARGAFPPTSIAGFLHHCAVGTNVAGHYCMQRSKRVSWVFREDCGFVISASGYTGPLDHWTTGLNLRGQKSQCASTCRSVALPEPQKSPAKQSLVRAQRMACVDGPCIARHF